MKQFPMLGAILQEHIVYSTTDLNLPLRGVSSQPCNVFDTRDKRDSYGPTQCALTKKAYLREIRKSGLCA
jgi:hypothetical protein